MSVCTEYTFKKYIDEEILSNLSMSETKNLVKSVLWKRNETFYFVSYPSEKDLGFECMTTPDSYDFVKPCSFPFYYEKSMIIEIPRKKVFICCMNKNSK